MRQLEITVEHIHRRLRTMRLNVLLQRAGQGGDTHRVEAVRGGLVGGRQRVEHVRHRHDAGLPLDRVAGEPARVALAVDALGRRRVQQILDDLVQSGDLAVTTRQGRGQFCTYRIQVGENAQPSAPFAEATASPASAPT